MNEITKEELIKIASRERGRKFREKNPHYMKEYAQKIKAVFNEKYYETIQKNNINFRNNNPTYFKEKYLQKKQQKTN
jgi:hypothetical protein